jgi:hypothetical protein
MSCIARLLSIACVTFVMSHAAAQSTTVAKPLAWKTVSTSKADRSPDAIFWFNQQFITVGHEWLATQRVGLVGRSARGDDWRFSNPASAPSTEIFASAQNETTLVVVPWNRISFQISTDGEQWTTVQSPANKISGEPAMVYALIYGNQAFIAVGQNGLVLSSPDARNWTVRRSAGRREPHLSSVAWNGKTYVAPYDNDRVLISANGRDWTVTRAAGAPEKGHIVWLGNKFRVINTVSQLYESEDGLSWSKHSANLGCSQDGSLVDIRNMVTVNGVWIVLGRCLEKRSATESFLWPKGLFALSHDHGVSWVHAAPGYYLRDIAFSPVLNRFAAAGYKRVPASSEQKEEVFVVSQ